MPIEAAISADAEWFVGEAKVLRFTVTVPEGTTDFEDWAARWQLRNRLDVVLIEKTTALNEIVLSEVGDTDPVRTATVQISADDYELVAAGTYQHALWRTDAGSEAVLSYGPAVLRSDLTA